MVARSWKRKHRISKQPSSQVRSPSPSTVEQLAVLSSLGPQVDSVIKGPLTQHLPGAVHRFVGYLVTLAAMSLWIHAMDSIDGILWRDTEVSPNINISHHFALEVPSLPGRDGLPDICQHHPPGGDQRRQNAAPTLPPSLSSIQTTLIPKLSKPSGS